MKIKNQYGDSLTSPSLPQMANDGVVNRQDLSEQGGVLITVQASTHAAKGDYLTLFWNGFQANLLYVDNDDPESFFPWSTVIPSEYVPEGSYPVWYTRMDQASNTITSSVVYALVQYDATGTLPAPQFPEAVDNTLYDTALTDGSTPVLVPVYPDIAVGDIVTVYWVGANSTGTTVPDSVDVLSHSVSSQDLTAGFTVNIDAPFVIATDVTQATAWYTVQPADGSLALSSNSATVLIAMSSDTLPPPFFPEGNDGWINASEASDGTPVSVPAYPGITVADIVTVFWQGYHDSEIVSGTQYSQDHSVTSADTQAGFNITIPASAIQPVGIGQGQAYYAVKFANSGQGVSAAATVSIDTVHTQNLPAPLYPEAVGDGVIDNTEYADGTPMQVAYPQMLAGDTVSLFWQQYEADGITPVSGTAWCFIYTVTSEDVQTGSFIRDVPPDFIYPINNSKAIGYYTVMFVDGGMANSDTTEVTIMIQGTPQLYLNAGTGAPYWENTSAQIRPVNTLTASGPAGALVTVSLTNLAFFTINGSSVYTANLDEAGSLILEVYSLTMGLVSITGYVVTDPGLTATTSMTFGDYIVGPGSLSGYAISTGVAANGLSTAGVYIRALDSSETTFAEVDITSGSATRMGNILPFIPLYDDGTCMVNLIDLVAEQVSLTLSLPQASGSAVLTHTTFVDFPPESVLIPEA